MKTYAKPSINVIELQLTENIAAVPTTVYTGSNLDLAKKKKSVSSPRIDTLAGLNIADDVKKDFIQSAMS